MNVLITGTSSGLGWGLANYYLENEHIVYGISRKLGEGQNGRKNFKFLSQDVTNFNELETNLNSFLKDVQTLDVVILNAGKLNEIKDLQETGIEEIKSVMEVNVWSNKILIDALYRNVAKIHQIVGISSGASVSGNRGWNAYSLSKATLNMLISLYSKEHTNTHFCALAPGLIESKMQDYIYDLPKEREYPTVQKLKSMKESGKMPDPVEAGEINAKAIEKVKNYKTGLFLDVRELNS